MATIKAVVLKHHKKEDGTFNVKVRVTHNRKMAYIASPFFVTKSDLNRNYEITSNDIQSKVSFYVGKLRKILNELSEYVESYSASELAKYLKKKTINKAGRKSEDFISFMGEYVDALKAAGKGSYKNYAPALRRLKEYAGDSVTFENITPSFLEKFEKHLSDNGTGQRGIALYMSCYRKIFNEARLQLNDDDKGIVVVKNYPFSRYKVPTIPESKEKAAGFDIVKQLYGYQPKGSEEELAKDMFFLSFYLVGINAVDLYSISVKKAGRIIYRRSKTKDKRADNAEISIRIEPEAIPLLEKYADPTGERILNLYKRYKSVLILNKALSEGFIKIRKELGIENLTFYSARHSWATIASHDCNITEDRIARCLNHVSMNYRVTSRYIKKDWSIIDEANRKVINCVGFW